MAKRKSPRKAKYRVFVSHAGDDIWLAEQIARNVEECGASAFLDRRDIAAGDNFKRRVHEEIGKCDELLAVFTPWSRRRAWVRHEIGMADMLGKRIVCVFYKVTTDDFRADEDGLGPLDGLNTIEINRLSTYFVALRRRAR
jgi:TIR domain